MNRREKHASPLAEMALARSGGSGNATLLGSYSAFGPTAVNLPNGVRTNVVQVPGVVVPAGGGRLLITATIPLVSTAGAAEFAAEIRRNGGAILDYSVEDHLGAIGQTCACTVHAEFLVLAGTHVVDIDVTMAGNAAQTQAPPTGIAASCSVQVLSP